MGIDHLILGTDALKIVQALEKVTPDLSVTDGLIEELKFLVSTSFLSFVCKHVPRSCNNRALELAALGVGCCEGSGHWSSVFPDCVIVNVVGDLLPTM